MYAKPRCAARKEDILSYPDNMYSANRKAEYVVNKWNPIAPKVPLILQDLNATFLPALPTKVKHLAIRFVAIKELNLEGLNDLKTLVVECCPHLTHIYNMPNSVKSIVLSSNTKLEDIHRLPYHLSYIRLWTLPALRTIPMLPTHLRDLVLNDMPLAEFYMPSFPKLLRITVDGILQPMDVFL
jgi:hypothetical protein